MSLCVGVDPTNISDLAGQLKQEHVRTELELARGLYKCQKTMIP